LPDLLELDPEAFKDIFSGWALGVPDNFGDGGLFSEGARGGGFLLPDFCIVTFLLLIHVESECEKY
jgi:hypothetical protein